MEDYSVKVVYIDSCGLQVFNLYTDCSFCDTMDDLPWRTASSICCEFIAAKRMITVLPQSDKITLCCMGQPQQKYIVCVESICDFIEANPWHAIAFLGTQPIKTKMQTVFMSVRLDQVYRGGNSHGDNRYNKGYVGPNRIPDYDSQLTNWYNGEQRVRKSQRTAKHKQFAHYKESPWLESNGFLADDGGEEEHGFLADDEDDDEYGWA